MATTSIRTAAKSALVSTLRTALAPVQVVYGWPGRNLERECVYVMGPFQGVVGYPVMMPGRKERDDIFVLSVNIFVETPGDSLQEVEERAEVLYAAVENALANDQTLANLAGVIEATLGPSVLGPNSTQIEDGAQAAMTADVTVHARLL